MPPRIDWESQLGRRMRLRDLHVFATTVRLGSMAKAARELGVSQPAVSEVIAELEQLLGVRLLDRTPRGVEPTVYGSALLRRSIAAFDELRQGIRDIEFLSDPTAGELRIGCPESIAAGYLQPVVARFAKTHPRVVLDVDTVNTQSFSPKLRERSLDLVLARGGWPLDEPSLVRIAAQDGIGLGYVMEADVRDGIAAGRLVRVLEDWTPPLAPLALYYPGRKNPPAAFSAFMQAARAFASAGG